MVLKKKRTYLDWAAAAPVSSSARHAYMRALPVSGNPSSPHEEGRAAKVLLEHARHTIARLAEVKPDAVIFTSGATEANALGIIGHINALIASGREAKGMHVLYLPSAHASVIGAIHALEAMGVSTEPLSVVGGAIDLKKLEAHIRPETVLVAVDVVCGETGALYDVRDVRRVLNRVSSSCITLFADASQAPRVASFALQHLGADMVTLDAQKVGGVRGIGALIASSRVKLLPLIQGGGQERGLRPGTEPVAHAVAFSRALEECTLHRDAFIQNASRMRTTLLSAVSGIQKMEVNEGASQAPHILNLSFTRRDTDYLVALLDEAGFAVSTKSACETDETGSRAVHAMTGDADRAKATLRISWGPTTRKSDITRFARALIRSVRFIDENAIY